MALDQVVLSLFTMAQITFAIWMMARLQPQRDRFAERATLVLAALVCGTVIVSWVGFSAMPSLTREFSIPTQFFTFTAVLAVMVVCVLVCYDVSVWMALFCVTAGYTIQNLASGCDGLARLVAQTAGLDLSALVPSAVCLVITTIIVYVPAYLLFVRRVERAGLTDIEDRGMLLMMVLVILVVIGFDLLNKGMTSMGMPAAIVVPLRLIHGIVCVFTLFMEYEMLLGKRLMRDVAAVSRAIEDEEKHYRLSQKSIEAINIKCHDLRHQIRDLRATGDVDEEALEKLEHDVTIYDSTVKTGNAELDVILTEKRLLCEREGITLSCIADGGALAFMSAADLYSLIGNALDNAMDAAEAVTAPEQRTISLVIRRSCGMAMVHEENRFSGTLRFQNGLPVSTGDATAGHGFGMRSMRLVCERYGGTLAATTHEDVFCLDVMIPER